MDDEEEQPSGDQWSSDMWRKALVEGQVATKWMRRLMRATPSSPRCSMCYAPFRGLGGRIFGLAGFSASRKNPNWCQRCFEEGPMGGAEVDTGVLFADIRGFTTFSESRSPEEVTRHANRFYAVAANVLARHDAVIDKMVGDEVMALFVPGFAGKDYVRKMAQAAEAMLRGVGYGGGEPWLPLGLGIDVGNAWVGNVGAGEVKDFTALGDVVNTAARLQGQARPGQIVMGERVYEVVAERYPEAAPVSLDLKGKSEPVAARIVDLSGVPVA